MLFGGKKEKLKEELAQLREADSYKTNVLEEISKQKDILEECVESLAISNAQMQKDFEVANENVRQLLEAAESNQARSEMIGQTVFHTAEETKRVQARQNIFLDAMKEQAVQIEDIVEQNKHFTTPMKTLLDFPAEYEKEEEGLKAQLAQMADLSKNMSVLSLNAAIEAGRMGESGKNFIAAAEEVRTFSEEYAKAATDAANMLSGMKQKIALLEEQTKALNELLKENNISMNKVWKEQTKRVTEYESAKVEVSGLISEEVTAETEQLLQTEAQITELGGRLGRQLQEMATEYAEQKSCTDELETAFQKINQKIEK